MRLIMENAKTQLDKVFTADLADVNIQLCLAAVASDDVPVFQRVNISTDVANNFRDVVISWMQQYCKVNQNKELILNKYEAQTKLEKHELEYITLSEHDEIGQQILALQDLTELDVFLAETDFVDSLRFYVVVVSLPDLSPVILFRFYSPKKELGRSRMFGMFMKNGQYDYFKEGMFLFDEHFDCFVFDNHLYIRNKDAFQKIFRFYEMLMKTAKHTLKSIEIHIPIENFEEFKQACEGHLQKVAKLKNIASKSYFKNLTIQDLKKVIAKYNLPIKTTGSGANEKLLFETSDKWSILRLLDDDYLESVMTGSAYEVNSKRIMN